MDAQLILSMVPATAVVFGVMVSFLTIYRRANAEREYLRLLQRRAEALRSVRNRVMHDGVVFPEELKRLIAALDQAAEGLSAQHRRLISAALHQPSIRGRARYAAQVMEKAGIGSGPLLLPTP
jgi:hypothetical protein